MMSIEVGFHKVLDKGGIYVSLSGIEEILREKFPVLFEVPVRMPGDSSVDETLIAKAHFLYGQLSPYAEIDLHSENREVVMRDTVGRLRGVLFNSRSGLFQPKGELYDECKGKPSTAPDILVIPPPLGLPYGRRDVSGKYRQESEKDHQIIKKAVMVADRFMSLSGIYEVGQIREEQHTANLCVPYIGYEPAKEILRRTGT